MAEEKFCCGCNEYHSIKEFNKRLDGVDGLNTYCKKYVNRKTAEREAKKKADRDFAKQFMPI